MDAEERALSEHIGARWAAFAHGSGAWWPYMGAAGEPTRTAKFEVGASGKAPLLDFKEADCKFWEAHPAPPPPAGSASWSSH